IGAGPALEHTPIRAELPKHGVHRRRALGNLHRIRQRFHQVTCNRFVVFVWWVSSLRNPRGKMVRSTLLNECIAEFIGTWVLVFVGTATVATAVTTGARIGLWQVAVVWGFGVTLAIFVSAHVSGAHLNPAVTIALAISTPRSFSRYKTLPYIMAQMLGAITSGVCVFVLYGTALARYEKINNITRGDDNSTLSAMAFGEYFPNPQVVKGGALLQEDISSVGAMAIEAVGTMFLMLMIRALTDEQNGARPSAQQVPFYIGFTVATIISFVAPFTQAGLNPARDLGPRIVAALAGWGSVALPGPNGGFWVYIVGPIIGSVIGTLLYDFIIYPAYVTKTGAAHDGPVILRASHGESFYDNVEKTNVPVSVSALHGIRTSEVNNPNTDSPTIHRISAASPGQHRPSWLLIFVGTATVAASVTTGAQVGLWQVAAVWGFTIATASFVAGHVSGAHLNPAVTIALAVYTPDAFPRHKAVPYIVAQMAGCTLGGLTTLLIYGSAIARYEKRHHVTRGDHNSTLSAMIFGEYFPNPQLVRQGVLKQEDVSVMGALVIEALATLVLMVAVRALTDEKNSARPSKKQTPFFIGFTVVCIASFAAPLTQAGLNPARDLGPRLVAALGGWHVIALPGPRAGFWVYVLGPIAGALAGCQLYESILYPAYIAKAQENERVARRASREGAITETMATDSTQSDSKLKNEKVNSSDLQHGSTPQNVDDDDGPAVHRLLPLSLHHRSYHPVSESDGTDNDDSIQYV
ncbi:TPA: hypothetical protein N0F65_002567, partial [Lagenidium giganteum]